MSQPPKCHLDRFSRFCMAQPCQTYRQIYRPIYAMQANNDKQQSKWMKNCIKHWQLLAAMYLLPFTASLLTVTSWRCSSYPYNWLCPTGYNSTAVCKRPSSLVRAAIFRVLPLQQNDEKRHQSRPKRTHVAQYLVKAYFCHSLISFTIGCPAVFTNNMLNALTVVVAVVSSSYLQIWHMTFETDLDSFTMNQPAKYLGER